MPGDLIQEALATAGRVRLTAGGRSMWPFIPDRSAVVIRRAGPGRVRLGEVAMLWTGRDRFLLHRVVAIRKNRSGRMVLLKGDRHRVPDGWYPESALAGVVSQVRPPGRWRPVFSGRLLRGLDLAAWALSRGTLLAGRLVNLRMRR